VKKDNKITNIPGTGADPRKKLRKEEECRIEARRAFYEKRAGKLIRGGTQFRKEKGAEPPVDVKKNQGEERNSTSKR